MPFIIKTEDRIGRIGWVGPPDHHGCRTIGTREESEVFHSFAAARAAIRRMPALFEELGIFYRVQAVDAQASSDERPEFHDARR